MDNAKNGLNDIFNVHFSYFIYLQSSTNTKLSSCFEDRELMSVSKYVVGGGDCMH
jgi:hypothetical protein